MTGRQIVIRPYDPALRQLWDDFVDDSKNGTFLFRRGYMDYHADRFADASLMLFQGDQLAALLPASRDGETVTSHGGLTYGGFVSGERMTLPAMLEIFQAALEHMRGQGVRSLRYKTVPHIYHRLPAEEDRYALFRYGARCYRCDTLSVIEMTAPGPMQARRRRAVRSAQKQGVAVCENDSFAGFWPVLAERLGERHGAKPVHTLDEITLLKSRFPDSIRLFEATQGGHVLAGVVIYDSGTVAHVQYSVAAPEGLAAGALDAIFAELIGITFAQRRWFDFGISNEDDGRLLNEGLVAFKEGFGARTVTHEFYELEL